MTAVPMLNAIIPTLATTALALKVMRVQGEALMVVCPSVRVVSMARAWLLQTTATVLSAGQETIAPNASSPFSHRATTMPLPKLREQYP